ncbi:MAG: hypothetical protein GXO88_14775 [Chlorobi bacterium]|nr:hypothetical protein [Chlorobiota bacterium]
MKKLLTFVLMAILYLTAFPLNAQQSENQQKNYSEYPYWIDMMQDASANFYETVDAFNQYWDGREITKGCGYKPFKRWEDHWRNRLNADGTRKVESEVYDEFEKFVSNYANRDNDFQGNQLKNRVIQVPDNPTGMVG